MLPNWLLIPLIDGDDHGFCPLNSRSIISVWSGDVDGGETHDTVGNKMMVWHLFLSIFLSNFQTTGFFGKIRCDHENLRYKTRTNYTDVWLVVRVEFIIKEVILKKILLMFSFVKFNKTSGNVVMTCLFKFNFKPLKLFRHSICNEHK